VGLLQAGRVACRGKKKKIGKKIGQSGYIGLKHKIKGGGEGNLEMKKKDEEAGGLNGKWGWCKGAKKKKYAIIMKTTKEEVG